MQVMISLAKNCHDVYYGVNWTWSNYKDALADVSWPEAITQVHGLNTIATLVYHTNYYVNAVLEVLRGGPLDAKDKYSFDHPPIQSEEDWQQMLKKMWADAEKFTEVVESLPEAQLWEPFADGKYGNYWRNILGVIEHNHYHLGQIVVIKKILRQQGA